MAPRAGSPSGVRSDAAFSLADYAGVVVDLDGVVYLGEEPLPGAARALDTVRGAGAGVVFATNNSSRTPDEVARSLKGMGVEAAAEEVVTSSVAAAELLAPGTRCLVIGMAGLRTALEARGCVEVRDPEDAQAVVVGWDRGLVWDDLRRATLALARGTRFVGTNGDVTYPAPEGVWPGNGATLAALTAASGRVPELAGKPEPAMFLAAAARLPAGPLLMVGDRPETDLVGAAGLGWDTALVLSGVTDAAAASTCDPPPTYVADSLAALIGEAPMTG